MSMNAIRALAAVRFFDRASGSTVTAPLRIEMTGARGVRNRSGLWVISAADGVPSDAPESIAPQSVLVSCAVFDDSGRYLPRAFSVAVPRAPHGDPDLFAAVPIDLSPSPAMPLRRTWAGVRVQVRFAPSASEPEGTPIEGALVRLHTPALELRGQSLSARNGQALAIGAGIAPFTPADEDTFVITPATPHQLNVVVDLAATDARTGRRTQLADPDDLWSRRALLEHVQRPIALAAGEQQVQLFDIPRS